MDKELILGVIGFLVWCFCVVFASFFLQRIYLDDMKKRYTIQVDDKVFVDICWLRISKLRRLVAFKDVENGTKVERYIYFDELHIMKLGENKK